MKWIYSQGTMTLLWRRYDRVGHKQGAIFRNLKASKSRMYIYRCSRMFEVFREYVSMTGSRWWSANNAYNRGTFIRIHIQKLLTYFKNWEYVYKGVSLAHLQFKIKEIHYSHYPAGSKKIEILSFWIILNLYYRKRQRSFI